MPARADAKTPTEVECAPGCLYSVFFLAIQYQMILWNMGIEINPLWVVVVVIFMFIGWIVFMLYRANRRKY